MELSRVETLCAKIICNKNYLFLLLKLIQWFLSDSTKKHNRLNVGRSALGTTIGSSNQLQPTSVRGKVELRSSIAGFK